MAFVVGTDTYISVADAKVYATANYLSASTKMIAWTALSDGDKEIVLRQAMRTLESLPVIGAKVLSTQVLQFPRIIYTNVRGNYSTTIVLEDYTNTYIQQGVPAAIVQAQVEIAMQLAVGVSKRLTLQAQGVTQFSVGGLSETFSKTGLSAVVSEEAQVLLKPYLLTSAGLA